MSDNTETILVESMVKKTDHSPAVIIKWGKNEGVLTPDEARDHALAILQAAEAAIQDSALYGMMIEQSQAIGDPNGPAIAAHMVASVRDFRNNGPKKKGGIIK